MKLSTEEGERAHGGAGPDGRRDDPPDERPWPSSARSLVVDIADFARGRFPGSRVNAVSLSLPRVFGTRVARTDRETTYRLQWRDRAGIRPASLLPSFYGGTLSDSAEDSSLPDLCAQKKRPISRGALSPGTETLARLLRVGPGLHRVLLPDPGVISTDDGLGGHAHLLQDLRRTGASVLGRSRAIGCDGLAHLFQL